MCRSAYTDSHVTGVRRLIGFKCCAWDKETGTFVCDLDYSSGWMVTWFGPLIVVGWVYIILVIKFIADYRGTKSEESFSARKIVEQLKLHVIKEVSPMSNKVPMADKPSELVSKYDEIRYMDIVDISRKIQLRIAKVTRVILLFLLFFGYYGYVAGSIVFYKSKELMISEMDTSDEVALNVFSHIGWILANETLSIRYYSIAELILTCLIPIMVIVIYLSQITKAHQHTLSKKIEPEAEASSNESKVPKLPPILPETSKERSFEMQNSLGNCTCFGRCLHSLPGKALTMACSIIVLLCVLAIASVHVAYMSYFLLKGAILSMTVLATWLLPAGLMLQYLRSVFVPLHLLYSYT